MKILAQIVLTFVTVVTFYSCFSNDSYKPNVTGVASDLLIVIDDTIKSSEAGILLQDIVTEPVPGLPQEEPLFNLIKTPHRAFAPHMSTMRNLIIVEVGNQQTADTILFFNDFYANGQALIKLTAKNSNTLEKIIKTNEKKIINYFLQAETKRGIDFIKKYPDQQHMLSIEKQWGIKLIVPNTYRKNKGSDSFSWFSEEGPVHTLGLLIYDFPYVGEGSFSIEYLINQRDSVLSKNLPGAAPGSYMATEQQFPVIYDAFELNGVKCAEIKGLWKVQGDLMGGPFVMHAHLDSENNRIIVTEGFAYSPEKPNKRNFMRMLESILYSYQPIEKTNK